MGPTLECSFIDANATSREVFIRVARALIANGADLDDWNSVDTATNAYAPLGEGTPEEMLERVMSLPAGHTFSAVLRPWLQSSRGKPELLINADFMGTPVERKPVRIDAYAIEWVPELRSAKLPGIAARVRKRFLLLCEIVAPSYATITIEQTLETPEELVDGPRSYAFRNFYVSNEIGPKALARLRELYRSAAIVELPAGLHISNDRLLNADRKHNPEYDSNLSHEAGRIIGRALRSRRPW